MTSPGECSTRPSTGHEAPLWSVALVVLIFGILARSLYLDDRPAYIHNDESATAIYITPPFFADPPDPIMWGQNNFGGHANFGAWLASLSIRYLGGKTLVAIRMGSIFLATLLGGTLACSSLMVESNFTPHMVAYGLLLPMLGALALETVCAVVGIQWHLLGALVAVVAFILWATWNYQLYTTLDKTKRNLDTMILHLPIQRERVKHIVNYSRYIADLAESFYMLRYPNANILKSGESKGTDTEAHLSHRSRSGECPCLAIVPASATDAVERSIHETGRKFKKFTFQPLDAKIVYVE